MTAINIALQPKHRCLHIVTDAAAYYADGTIGALGSKVFKVERWPGAIAVRGTACADEVLGQELDRLFASFDDVVAGIERVLELLCGENGLTNPIELILAGWSAKHDRPESYVIETSNETPVGISAEDATASEYYPSAFRLTRLPDWITGPPAPIEMVNAAQFEGVDVDAHPEVVIGQLRKLLEMQRHAIYPGCGHKIGGYGQLTTIRPDGIEERRLQEWPEDKIGELIQPRPISWPAWNAANKASVAAAAVPAGLSRLQRERMEKKARKGTLRLAT